MCRRAASAVRVDQAPRDRSAARPGWVRDAPVPRALDELRDALTGVVDLPVRLFWSRPDPRAVRWDLVDPGRSRDLYEIALVGGTAMIAHSFLTGDHLGRQSTVAGREGRKLSGP